jgi:hypothetical protein
MTKFWDNSTTAAPLTREMLEDCFRQITEAPYPPPHGSEENPHILHPDSLKRDGWFRCECGLVPVKDGQVDYAWGVEQLSSVG